MLNVNVQFEKGDSFIAIQRMQEALSGKDRKRLTKKIAMGVAVELRRKFRQNATKPNRLAAPSSGFWMNAVGDTTTEGTDEYAIVRVARKGVALQRYGGVVRPKNSKMLAIPQRPEFHGHSPSKFDRNTFFSMPSRVLGKAFLCVRPSDSREPLKVAYLLTPKARINPHPEKFLSDAEIGNSATKAINNFMEKINNASK